MSSMLASSWFLRPGGGAQHSCDFCQDTFCHSFKVTFKVTFAMVSPLALACRRQTLPKHPPSSYMTAYKARFMPRTKVTTWLSPARAQEVCACQIASAWLVWALCTQHALLCILSLSRLFFQQSNVKLELSVARASKGIRTSVFRSVLDFCSWLLTLPLAQREFIVKECSFFPTRSIVLDLVTSVLHWCAVFH